MKNNILRLFILTVSLLAIIISLISCGHTHTEEVIQNIPATCTENGYTEGTKCAECGEILVAPTVIEKKGHTEATIPSVEKTCCENGYTEGVKCSVCNEILVEPQVILASHTVVAIPAVPPQVGKTGYTEGEQCSSCQEFLVEPQEITLLEIVIDEQGSQKGIVACSLSITEVESELSLYYADGAKEKLPYYNELAKIDKSQALNLEGLIIPSGCEYIIASDGGEYNYFVPVPKAYQLSSKEYTFGALSDVHYGDGDYLGGALDLFDDYGIDFVGVAGDLSTNGEVSSYEKFNAAIKERLYKVYTVTGNHDAQAVANGKWLENVNLGTKDDQEVFDIGENGLDFVFIPKDSENNAFVFLCQTNWDYARYEADPEKYYLLEERQITWLSQVFEKYKDKNVFLFFHTFLSGPEGGQEDAVGNLKNPGGYSYDLPYSYGAKDEVALRSLLKQYKNVVFFSGHSHWMFEMEIYNENLNISSFDGEYGYMVHVPSVCTPRWIGENDTRRTNKMGDASEGWIVEVHDEAIVLIPVDFLAQVFYTEYIKIIPLN